MLKITTVHTHHTHTLEVQYLNNLFHKMWLNKLVDRIFISIRTW